MVFLQRTFSSRPSTTELMFVNPIRKLTRKNRFTSIAGQDTSKPLPYDPSLPVKEQVTSSFATTLKNLRTTYVDSYILHSPLDTMKKTVEAWRVLVSLKEDGRALAIGVSNTYSVDVLKALEDATGVPVDVVQNRWHENNGWDKEVASYCRERGIQYQ
jgi:diketogulonate reductase-like aldo/keto reductase